MLKDGRKEADYVPPEMREKMRELADWVDDTLTGATLDDVDDLEARTTAKTLLKWFRAQDAKS